MNNLIFRVFSKFIGCEVKIWQSNASPKDIILPHPPSSEYVRITQTSRRLISSYFSDRQRFNNDIELQSYVQKYFDIIFMDYCAFRYVAQKYPNAKIIDKSIQKRIYESIHCPTHLGIKYAFFMILRLIFDTLRSVIFSLSPVKEKLSKIIYLRKKMYSELGVKDLISERLKRYHNLEAQGAYIFHSTVHNKYSFWSLNAFTGSTFRALASFGDVLIELTSYIKMLKSFNLPLSFSDNLIIDAFRAANIVRLNANVYVGILVDKPGFILMHRAKKNHQKFISLNESFFYPPFRSFDYTHIDIYFSMNYIDENMINNNGGHIEHFQRIPFFRHGLKTNSNGISDDLIEIMKTKSKCVLATPIQIAEKTFEQWDKNDLNNFAKAILDLAKRYPDYLFILKGKKGELNYITPEIRDAIISQNNIYIIFSIKPRELKNNQFEDLLINADILISMSHTSTTIWQALRHGIPAIGINNVHDHSFLRDFENFEVRLNELPAAFNYWINLDTKKRELFFNQVFEVLNVSEEDPFRIMAETIALANDEAINALKQD